MEDLDAVAERIGEHDKVLDPPLVGERARAARKLDAGLLQPCREVVERGRVRHLPAEESHALAAVLVHDHALLAVVHPQRQALAALVDELHAEKPGAEGGPVLERLRANADIAETLNIHGQRPPWADARHPASKFGVSGAGRASSVLRGNMRVLDDLGNVARSGASIVVLAHRDATIRAGRPCAAPRRPVAAAAGTAGSSVQAGPAKTGGMSIPSYWGVFPDRRRALRAPRRCDRAARRPLPGKRGVKGSLDWRRARCSARGWPPRPVREE